MAPPKKNKRSTESGSPRTRSFGGCVTCRMRHMKCDEGKPSCLMCQHFGIPCGGYEKNLFFATEDNEGLERFRRPLFTEDEREEMSVYLVSSIPARTSLLKILSQIDEEGESADSKSPADFQIRRGPFGAFKVAQNIRSSSVSLFDGVEVPYNPVGVSDRPFSPSAFTFSPQTQEIFELFIQSSDNLLGVPSPDNFTTEFDQSRIEELFGDSTSPDELASQLDPTIPPLTDISHLSSTDQTDSSSSPRSIASLDAVPRTAVQLLKHYSNTVISLLTPSRNTKTLWHVLFLPNVKNSLAALSMGEILDHASMSSFYGTLAISAFHLKATSKGTQWYEEGRQYKQKAVKHAEQALLFAYDIPKVAKYKSILMALLTMAQLSMFDGDWKQTEFYLLEAEKFIRLRGLHRRKSRKRRLLHHCYAFMRLMHESLFLMATHSQHRMHVRLAVESSGLVIRGQDRPVFRLSAWGNLVQKMLQVKTIEEGENDLHLENPGLNFETMYPEIYGLPEEFMVMLSQVIRLGNEKDPQNDGSLPLSLAEFSVRAKDLEQCIINWHRPPADIFCSTEKNNAVDERVLRPLLEALHQALVIYFYRRIHNIDASMLQKRVDKARESLMQCDNADPGRIRYTSVFIWPAFIAACEAIDPQEQASFAVWFDDCVSRSGQQLFRHMYIIVKQVWHERDQSEGSSVTWLDFMKNSSVMQ